MSSCTIKLPIIDFSDLGQQSPATWESVKSQVHQALRDYGCFEAIVGEISDDIRRLLSSEIVHLFDLPTEVKMSNRTDQPFRGYVGQHPLIPLYESLGIPDALAPGSIEKTTYMMWPQGNPNFSKCVRTFVESLSQFDKTVRRMIVESLGLNKYMDDHINSTEYLFRTQKYDTPKSQEEKVGLTSHSDNTFGSILFSNQVKGLEVLTKDGQWIDANPSENSFIFMIGEGLHAWTNGRVHAPYHRVMMSGDEARYSIALFSIPKEGYIVKAPEEMVDEHHPLLFKPYDHAEFIKFFYSKAGLASPRPLKAYCGVD